MCCVPSPVMDAVMNESWLTEGGAHPIRVVSLKQIKSEFTIGLLASLGA